MCSERPVTVVAPRPLIIQAMTWFFEPVLPRGVPECKSLGFLWPYETLFGFQSPVADQSALFETQKGFHSLQLGSNASFRRRLNSLGTVI